MSAIPLLFLGDSPSLPTGLARIGRDLATAVSRLPQYRVAYLGRGGIADTRLPFPQYTFAPRFDDQWGARYLRDVWRNHSSGERGIIFTCGWDPSRVTWFGNPQRLGGEWAALSEWLVSGEFERWGYFAIDGEGPHGGGGLSRMLAETVAGYDRVLAYSRFGKRVIEASLDMTASGPFHVEWAPHGIDLAVWTPRDRQRARAEMSELFGRRITDAHALVGCVMSNQERKDWGLWAETMRALLHMGRQGENANVLAWAHTDSLDRYWDLRALVDDFGLSECAVVTVDRASDVEMSWRYSACDVTVLPSLGEGFGYPIAESLACGVPCVHGAYAAGAELLPDDVMIVKPVGGWRYDTRWCVKRPMYAAGDWAAAVVDVLGFGPTRELPSVLCTGAVEHLGWSRLWPRVWERWWVEGAARFAR